jgi:S1-C subfamily serine protease
MDVITALQPQLPPEEPSMPEPYGLAPYASSATVDPQEPPQLPPAMGERPWAWETENESPPAPPTGDILGNGSPRHPRRRRWPAMLLALVLLVALVTGIGFGGAVIGARTASSSSITISTSSSTATTASSASASSLQQNVESVIQAVQPSVVEITSTSGQQEAIGSGEILTKDGYIVTNDHVVQGYSSYTVTLWNGKTLSAHLIGEDAQDDLAVLKVAASNLKPITFADSSKVAVGEFAIAVGNPLGLEQSATFGIVSALNRTASESSQGSGTELTGLIQTSAPINPGNSGGALVNLQGQLIGIPTLSAVDTETGTTADGIGYAIAANRVQYVAEQLIQHGQVSSSGQGFLGVQSEDVTPVLAAADGLLVQSGTLVTGFANDAAGQSPAQQAGLRTGDVIVAVNNQAIPSGGALAALLTSDAPGTQVTLTVVRGSQQLTIHATLGERPLNG